MVNNNNSDKSKEDERQTARALKACVYMYDAFTPVVVAAAVAAVGVVEAVPVPVAD